MRNTVKLHKNTQTKLSASTEKVMAGFFVAVLLSVMMGKATAYDYDYRYGPDYTHVGDEPYVDTSPIDNSHYGDREAEYDRVDYQRRYEQMERRDAHRNMILQKKNRHIREDLEWQQFNDRMRDGAY